MLQTLSIPEVSIPTDNGLGHGIATMIKMMSSMREKLLKENYLKEVQMQLLVL